MKNSQFFDLDSSTDLIEQSFNFKTFDTYSESDTLFSNTINIHNTENFIPDPENIPSEFLTDVMDFEGTQFILLELPTSAESKEVTLKHSFLEVLARDFAYKDWFDSTISENESKLKDSPYNTNKVPYKVDKIWNDRSTGFAAVGLTAPDQPSILAIKGSATTLDFFDDTNPKGVGFKQFYANKESVADWLNTQSKSVQTLPYITGHSLGGALSQWMASYSTSTKGTSLAEVVTFNAPGISPNVNVDGKNYGSNYFKPENVKNGVTHYVTTADIVSLAGANYIEGKFQQFEYVVRPNFILGPHRSPILAESIGDKQKPSDGVLQENYFPFLNSSGFNYDGNLDHALLRLIIARIPGVGPAFAFALGNRGRTESFRVGTGFGIRSALEVPLFIKDNVITALINGGSSAINAIKGWTLDAWESVSVWTEDSWRKASNWTKDTWENTKNYTSEQWNKITNTLIDATKDTTTYIIDNAKNIINIINPFRRFGFGTQTFSDESLDSGEADTIFSNNSTLEVRIRISEASDQIISLEYSTEDDTAIEGKDYLATSGTLTFLPGETEKLIPVQLLNFDTWQEGKTFDIQLSNPENILLLFDDKISVTVQPNNPPLVFNSISEQNVTVNQLFTLEIPSGTFIDDDISQGDRLTYTATLADGRSLPSWLTFDPATLSFRGTPRAINLDNLTIKVTATDKAGESATLEFPLNVVMPREKRVLAGSGDIGTLFKDNEDNNIFVGSNFPDVYKLNPESSNIIKGNLTQLNGALIRNFDSDDVILVKDSLFSSQQLTFNENILQIDANSNGETDVSIVLEGDYSNGLFIVQQVLNDTMITFNSPPTAIFLTNAITELTNSTLVRDGIELAKIVVEDDGLGLNEIFLTGKDKERFEVRNNALFLIGENPNSEIQDQYEVTLNVHDPSINNKIDVKFDYTLKIVDNSNGADFSLNTPFSRFQNSELPGVYIWVGEEERQTIQQNYPNFREEGFAFNVAVEPNDNLVQFNRFQNELGAYLYATEEESVSIRENYTNFKEEGIAFYALDSNGNRGIDIYRLQNTQQLGTYIFVGEEEKNNILTNFPQFQLEGVAFQVNV